MRVLRQIAISIILISALSAEWNGQFSTIAGIGKDADGHVSKFGMQYIPTWSLTVPWPTALFDTEISFNINTTFVQPHYTDREIDFNLKAYRLWFRKSTDILELRFGLQKITFGNARIFRSLMWFDRINPTDPLQLTEGVWGARAVRYFDNNTNIWLWGLLWNKEPKGWDTIPTKKNNIEFGGRFQLPFPRGEIGFTGHNRIISRNDLPNYLNIKSMSKSTPEFRGALDGYFDLGIGLWFESTIIHTDFGDDHPNWQSFLTLGGDYTFNMGNGISLTCEHFIYSIDDKPLTINPATKMSALMITYPISIFDNLSGFLFYSWNTELTFYYLNWQRTYDDWTFVLSAYLSSDTDSSFSFNKSTSNFSNRGIQLMLVYNH